MYRFMKWISEKFFIHSNLRFEGDNCLQKNFMLEIVLKYSKMINLHLSRGYLKIPIVFLEKILKNDGMCKIVINILFMNLESNNII